MADRFEGVGDARPYRGTAFFYAEHRGSLSDEFVDALVAVSGWRETDRVLDLGSGPGQIARRLARKVEEVVAVDPEPDMVIEGKKRVAEDGLDNVVFVEGSSDDLEVLGVADAQFVGVTIGSAFHWMTEQDDFLRRLDPYVDDSGAVIIVNWDVDGPTVAAGVDPRPWHKREPWNVVDEILDRYLADVAPGPHPAGRHDPFEEIFSRSAFSELSFLRWEYEREVAPSVRGVIGQRYSISNVLARLGARRPEFEDEVQRALAGADTSPVRERVVDSALIARRPGSREVV